MRKFNIKVVSQENSIVLIVSLLAIYLGGIGIFFPKGMPEFGAILLVMISFVITYFLWQKFVTGRTEWTIDDNGVQMIWTKQFSLSNNSGISLNWTEIESFTDRNDPYYHTFKIKLISGETIKFYHDNLTSRDDFMQFKKALNQTLNEKKQPNFKNISE